VQHAFLLVNWVSSGYVGAYLIGWVFMFKITEGQYALGGLTVFAVWLFAILPLANYSGTHDMLNS
jgi:hypothetical protein